MYSFINKYNCKEITINYSNYYCKKDYVITMI